MNSYIVRKVIVSIIAVISIFIGRWFSSAYEIEIPLYVAILVLIIFLSSIVYDAIEEFKKRSTGEVALEKIQEENHKLRACLEDSRNSTNKYKSIIRNFGKQYNQLIRYQTLLQTDKKPQIPQMEEHIRLCLYDLLVLVGIFCKKSRIAANIMGFTYKEYERDQKTIIGFSDNELQENVKRFYSSDPPHISQIGGVLVLKENLSSCKDEGLYHSKDSSLELGCWLPVLNIDCRMTADKKKKKSLPGACVTFAHSDAYDNHHFYLRNTKNLAEEIKDEFELPKEVIEKQQAYYNTDEYGQKISSSIHLLMIYQGEKYGVINIHSNEKEFLRLGDVDDFIILTKPLIRAITASYIVYESLIADERGDYER